MASQNFNATVFAQKVVELACSKVKDKNNTQATEVMSKLNVTEMYAAYEKVCLVNGVTKDMAYTMVNTRVALAALFANDVLDGNLYVGLDDNNVSWWYGHGCKLYPSATTTQAFKKNVMTLRYYLEQRLKQVLAEIKDPANFSKSKTRVASSAAARALKGEDADVKAAPLNGLACACAGEETAVIKTPAKRARFHEQLAALSETKFMKMSDAYDALKLMGFFDD